MKKVISVILAMVCLSCCVLFSGCGDDSALMTLEEFNKIETGMSYEEVKAIVGSDGELASETGKEGDRLHIAIYTWKGKGEIGANAMITFSNEVVESKVQAGLK